MQSHSLHYGWLTGRPNLRVRNRRPLPLPLTNNAEYYRLRQP